MCGAGGDIADVVCRLPLSTRESMEQLHNMVRELQEALSRQDLKVKLLRTSDVFVDVVDRPGAHL